MRRVVVLAVLAAGVGLAASGGDDDAQRRAVVAWVAAHRPSIVAELEAFLSLPNVSSDGDALRVNAAHLVGLLEKRGIEARIVETAGRPYVFGHLGAEDSKKSRPPVVLFYAHFDGQPVDPARWSVTEPFDPVLRGEIADPEARLFARSASDDKGPIVALMAAIDALRGAGIPPTVEAKFLFDPEEEIGSPQIAELIAGHADLLAADLMIFADGPVHQSGRPTVVFGTRGIVTLTLTVYGPVRPLHSGHYGNWAPNPAEKLARLLASMSDPSGRVLVEGFYDDVLPLSESERAALARIPRVEEALMDDLLVGRPEGDGLTLQELINLPSLNVRGMASGWVGEEARTIVPATATAEIDLRLVKGIEPQA
ncbi:MAG: M20/M25/M40 family metallo-hydrolase, partial [Acidobacteriota bacterium]|nr:M20/M25/M40 family metallo-hydrolase [Acidobacteriota bacterium]